LLLPPPPRERKSDPSLRNWAFMEKRNDQG
jgi:hypothetical protein